MGSFHPFSSLIAIDHLFKEEFISSIPLIPPLLQFTHLQRHFHFHAQRDCVGYQFINREPTQLPRFELHFSSYYLFISACHENWLYFIDWLEQGRNERDESDFGSLQRRMNPILGSKSYMCTGGQEPQSSLPNPPWTSSKSAPMAGSGGNKKAVGGLDCHQSSPSHSIYMEGQLSWLDDLLNEPDTNLVHRVHRRSASDTFAYIGAVAKAFDTWEEPNQNDATTSSSNTSIWAQSIVNFKGSNETKLDVGPSSFENKFKKDSKAVVSESAETDETEESCSQTSKWSVQGTISSKAKPSGSKPETKRTKQQSAHRSRVRKLQYIAHLERTVQVLQATGSKMSAELEFLDHQNLILNMENRALKQRLDSISQEQLIKQFEHEMLERELGRLQALCQLQGQEQMRMQQQQNPKNRRTKNKDASSFRGPVNDPV